MAKIGVWMPIYIGDYLSDTTELSAIEHGAYLLLLMHYWQKDGEIGSDIDRLARVARSDSETARFILGSYFTLENGNYKNKRADLEMENAKKRRDTATKNGKKGGRPPLNNPQETGGLSSGLPEANPQKSSSPSPSHIIQEEEREEASAVADLRREEEAKKQSPEEAQRLASLLFALHRDQIDPGFRATPAQLAAWALDIDKLNRIDGRAWADIEAAIRWIQAPGCFWASNILSGKKLREKFATVWGQMKRPSGPPPRVASQSRMLEMGE